MIQRLRNNRFVKNVSLLLSGNVLAQLIPIAVSVVITRLYSPNDFAVLAYFLTISGIIGVIAGGRYELAIMLPKEKYKANALYLLSLIFTILFSFIVFIVCLFFGEKFALLFNASELINFVYLIPLSILFVGFYQASNFYANRYSKYKLMSTTVITRSVFTASTNISLGWLNFFSGGLIVGNLVGQFVAALLLSFSSLNELFRNFPTKRELKDVLVEYKDFPLKNGISIFFNLLGNQIPILMIGYLFQNNEVVGWYALVIRVLNLPLMTVGKSVSQVFYQETNQSDMINHRNMFKKTSLALLLIILLPAVILLFSGPLLFSFVFGEIWEEAGFYSQIFIGFYLVRFIFSSQSTLLISARKLKTELLFNFSFFFFQISSVFAGYQMGSYEYSFIFMAATGFIHFLVLGKILLSASIQLDNEKIG